VKKLFIAIALVSTSLTACTTVPPAPVDVANKTVLDERAAIGVELAYKAARLAIETAVDAGLVKGQRATAIAELDRTAYKAVLAARAAYRTGNAPAYDAALLQAQVAISSITSILGS
jgi:hypothetical protein